MYGFVQKTTDERLSFVLKTNINLNSKGTREKKNQRKAGEKPWTTNKKENEKKREKQKTDRHKGLPEDL